MLAPFFYNIDQVVQILIKASVHIRTLPLETLKSWHHIVLHCPVTKNSKLSFL